MNQLKAGTRVESEHKKTFRFIKSYFNKHKKLPPERKVFASIAKDHIKEHKNYYTKLKQARL